MPSLSMSSGQAPVTPSSSSPLACASKRRLPPCVLALRQKVAGASPPGRSRSSKPSPLQSKTATPPPTMYSQSPAQTLSMPAFCVSSTQRGIASGPSAWAGQDITTKQEMSENPEMKRRMVLSPGLQCGHIGRDAPSLIEPTLDRGAEVDATVKP